MEVATNFDVLEDAAAGVVRRADALERPLSHALATDMVAQEVEGDGVESGLLARLPRVEATTRAQHSLEGVGQEILGEHSVARAEDQEAKQRLRVLRVHALEGLPLHGPDHGGKEKSGAASSFGSVARISR